MKKIFLIILPVVLLTACVESLDDWNTDQKRASVVPARTLFTNALKGVTDILTTPNVNSNNFRMFVQYWATTTYLDEPRYNMTQRLYSQNIWYAVYRDALSDLKEAKLLVNEDILTAAAVKNNQLALIEIMEVYCWTVLIHTFGDVPYSEALDSDLLLPKYDDAATIYSDLFVRLDAALGMLTPGTASFGSADLLYNGSVAKWVLFGNSLKLKMGMTVADVDATTGRTAVESAFAAGVIASQADNARYPYISAPPNNNPISANLNPIFSSREDFVMASTIIDAMNERNDPRREFYFTTVDGEYVGGNYGFSNAYGDYSHVSEKIIEPTFEALLIDVSEIEFMLAEAVERGFNVTGTAEEHYNNAITESILYWGGTEADAADYLAQANVAYTTASGDWKEKIGVQKWIALNNRGWDAWVEWRRLDYPQLLPPSGPSIPNELFIPVRMIYPVIEQTVNGDQWSTAAARYNSDSPNAKLFWDVN
jgi:Starch-binding associating with outer membrane